MRMNPLVLIILLLGSVAARAETIEETIRDEISKRYEGARIELEAPITWTQNETPTQIRRVELGSESPKAEIRFRATGLNEEGKITEFNGMTRFSAWKWARIAQKRILPGQPLGEETLGTQELNVAVGQLREMRGLILDTTVSTSALESRQTILEGQPVLSTAVRKIPDLRKGDPVRIEIRSNDLAVTTQGIAEEPGYLNALVRVSAGKGKRELQGRVREGNRVEVQL